MERMDSDQWVRKYVDTHKGISAVGELLDKKSRKTIIDPSDFNAHKVTILKQPIESKCFKERAEDLQHFIMDTVSVRAEDMLDKNQLPAKDLLKIAAGIIPKQLNVEQNVNHSFTSLWDDIDIDKVEEADE